VTELDIVAAEAVRIVSGFYDDFRETMQTVIRLEAVLFFPTMTFGEEAFVQPIVIPAHLANQLNEALRAIDPMHEHELADYIAKVFRIMQVNSVVPAPVEYHINLLEMFQRIAINSMPDKPELLENLGKLGVGDLALLQFSLEDQAIETGVRIIPKALDIYEQNLLTVPSSVMVH
jgi:hypothetical protein